MKPTAARMARRVTDTDDRRVCNTCAQLVGGRCQANESTVLRDVPRDVLHRCAGFRAKAGAAA